MSLDSTLSYSPREATELISRAGVRKANMRIDKVLVSSINAGLILSFACATYVSVLSSPWFQENAPGLIRVLGALVFPYGLVIIIISGMDLCTGSILYTTLAALHGRLSPLLMLKHWAVTFVGNLVGTLFVSTFRDIEADCCNDGGIFDHGAFNQAAKDFAVKKQVTPDWHQIFIRGIGANWMVCLACYMSTMGRDFGSKVMGVWWPSFAFVSLGFDHVVANMWFISNGIRHGAPGISVGLYIWKGIIPAGLGNIVGGGFFVATILWYLHIFQEPSIEIVEAKKPSLGQSSETISRTERTDTSFLKNDTKVAVKATEVV